ncbi:MAG: PAS domain S-box protein [Rhodocyclaceae bacterium]|nr:PAS domain S-box protein [Rhodocyclaceae bacterium]
MKKTVAKQQSLTAPELASDRYADLYEFAPCAYLTLTEQGVIAEVNRAGAALLGLDREAVLDRPFTQFVEHEDIDLWSRNLASLVRQEDRLNFEITLLRGEGSPFCAQIDGRCLANEGMRPVVLVVLTDIAARKQAEVALREQEKFFRLIAENLGDFIAVLDLEGRRIYNSPSYQRLFGDTRDLRGTDSFAEIHEDDRPRIKEAFRETLRTGIGQRTDYRFVLADGSIRQMESVGGVIKDSAGRVARVVVVARDITERKQAEDQLRIAAIAFEAHEGMLVTDDRCVIQCVNHAFSKLTGYSAMEAIGRTPGMLGSGRHDAAFYAAMWESIHRNGSWQGEIWNRRKSGEVYPQWLTIAAVRNGDGVVTTHYVATMTDISERKTAEDKIRRQALYDDLTQLPNRRLLMDRLQKALAASARSGRRGALLLIDLDNFKEVNDTHGHGHGDLLLQQVAQRLNKCIREADTVARLGGDEFVVMLTDLSESSGEAIGQAEVAGDKILAALNQFYDLLGKEHHSTPSIGVTLFADQRQSVDELLKQADLAMYRSKSAGRNTLRFFDPALSAGPGSMPDATAPEAGSPDQCGIGLKPGSSK